MTTLKRHIALLCVLHFICVSPGFAETSRPEDDERIQALEKMVESLTKTVQELSRELDQLKSERQVIPEEYVPAPPSAPEPAFMDMGPIEEPSLIPKLNIYGFGSFSYNFEHDDWGSDGTSADTNHFTQGDMALFFTSQLSDKISFFNEDTFKFKSNNDGDADLVVERLLLKYTHADWLKISIGRGHTALGYWNQSFHSGAWLQTTADTPKIVRNRRAETFGHSFLLNNYHGIEISGSFDLEPGKLSYVSTVANGRGQINDNQYKIDANDDKFVHLLLRFEPSSISDFGFGPMVYFNKIPTNLDDEDGSLVGRADQINETVFGGHIFYTEYPYEFLMEGFWVEHKNRQFTQKDESFGGYVQLAHTFGKWKPYYRFELMSIDDRDPFYSDPIFDEVINIFGLRYDLTSFNSIKVEFRNTDSAISDKNEFTLQSAWAF